MGQGASPQQQAVGYKEVRGDGQQRGWKTRVAVYVGQQGQDQGERVGDRDKCESTVRGRENMGEGSYSEGSRRNQMYEVIYIHHSSTNKNQKLEGGYK